MSEQMGSFSGEWILGHINYSWKIVSGDDTKAKSQFLSIIWENWIHSINTDLTKISSMVIIGVKKNVNIVCAYVTREEDTVYCLYGLPGE